METSQVAPAQINCWKCKKQIDGFDGYCRHCGAGQGNRMPFYYKLFGVWVLFFCIGPLNLYFLFKSPSISKTAKIINAAVFIVLSWWAAYAFYKMIKGIFDIYSSFLYMPI